MYRHRALRKRRSRRNPLRSPEPQIKRKKIPAINASTSGYSGDMRRARRAFSAEHEVAIIGMLMKNGMALARTGTSTW